VNEFKRKLIDDKGVGECLREARESLGYSLKDIEERTGIRCKYLIALEEHDFAKLPEPVYAKNFVRALSRQYGLDPEAMTDALLKEMVVITGSGARRSEEAIDRLRGKRLIVTPVLVKMGLLSFAFLTVLIYFSWSVHSILKPPKLIVYTPEDSQVFEGRRVLLEGKTEPEVELTVNREPVVIGADGSFNETLNLPEGVSILRVAAKKRHSKPRELYIKVVIDSSKGADSEVSRRAKVVAKK